MLIGRYSAVLDACVLHPTFLRASLLWLATERLYRPLWSEQILNEWEGSIRKKRPDISDSKLAQLRADFGAFPDAMVERSRITLPDLTLSDPNDAHVIETGVLAHADAIITANLKHFPVSELAKVGLEPIHPDTFLVNIIDLDEVRALGSLRRQRQMMSRSEPTVDEFLARFANCQLPQTYTRLKALRSLL